MPDTIISVDTLPTIVDRSCWATLQEQSEKACENGIFSTQQWCQRNAKWIVATLFVTGIAIGVVVILLNNNKAPNLPCISYSQQSLASSVSIECVQYMWTAHCGTRSPYTFPANYVGWWNQSPEGTDMVPCNGLKKGTACGVGSYSNMITYMQYCNLRFNQ
jgi:hypothetical protein